MEPVIQPKNFTHSTASPSPSQTSEHAKMLDGYLGSVIILAVR